MVASAGRESMSIARQRPRCGNRAVCPGWWWLRRGEEPWIEFSGGRKCFQSWRWTGRSRALASVVWFGFVQPALAELGRGTHFSGVHQRISIEKLSKSNVEPAQWTGFLFYTQNACECSDSPESPAREPRENMSIIAGIGWHMVGAASAASFYAPIEKVKKWSWETTWAVAGLFLVDPAAHRRELSAAAAFRRVLFFDPHGRAVEGGAVRGHVGRGQRELRTDHALPGHVAGDRRGHRRDTGGGHAGAAADAWAGRDPLSYPGRPVQHGGSAWWR